MDNRCWLFFPICPKMIFFQWKRHKNYKILAVRCCHFSVFACEYGSQHLLRFQRQVFVTNTLDKNYMSLNIIHKRDATIGKTPCDKVSPMDYFALQEILWLNYCVCSNLAKRHLSESKMCLYLSCDGHKISGAQLSVAVSQQKLNPHLSEECNGSLTNFQRKLGSWTGIINTSSYLSSVTSTDYLKSVGNCSIQYTYTSFSASKL